MVYVKKNVDFRGAAVVKLISSESAVHLTHKREENEMHLYDHIFGILAWQESMVIR